MKLLKTACLVLGLAALAAGIGCSKNPADMGAGSSSVSTGAGGDGSGPTGTGGSEPADNPAPDSNGTGGN